MITILNQDLAKMLLSRHKIINVKIDHKIYICKLKIKYFIMRQILPYEGKQVRSKDQTIRE